MKPTKSPFTNWYQTNNSIEAYLTEDWLIGESPTAYRILKFLASHMDHYNSIICSYKILQEYFGFSQPTIARAIKLLKEKNFIQILKSGTSNVYLVNKTLYWKSWGDNYKYAEFGTKIIVSLSEQEKAQQKQILKDLKLQKNLVNLQHPHKKS